MPGDYGRAISIKEAMDNVKEIPDLDYEESD